MAVRRSGRQEHTELSFDSLIDVFMNVVGVLMLTAVVMALSVRSGPSPAPETQEPAQAAPPPPQPQPQPPVTQAPRRSPVQLRLPQVREVGTEPLFVFVSADGLRPLGLGDECLLQRSFSVTALAGQLLLEPRPASVMRAAAFRDWIRTYSTERHHIVAVVSPDGAARYREVREAALAAGFRSGWLEHQGGPLRVGEGGRDGRSVQ
jgi:biopolymer transport protein ExbD